VLCRSNLSLVPIFSKSAVGGDVEIESKCFFAACTAERSAPSPRWKSLAGGLSRLKFRICAQEKTC
jgi:hypothetical protein